MTRVIDCLVNVDFADRYMANYMTRVKEDYFKADESFFSSPELGELIDLMDEKGVEKAILICQVNDVDTRSLRFVEARPDRFALGVGGFDLLKPMKNLANLEAFVANNPVAYASVGPSFWGDGMYPPTDAVYYPLYVKCCELDLALSMNMGMPGPPLPAEPQNPIHLDRVLYRFPELRLVMMHGADPWWEVAIRIMLKYRNVRMMTSAWAPKYLPEVLLHFMRTRGKERVMFASDYPVLKHERLLAEADALDLPDDVRDNWLYGNANSFFFRENSFGEEA
ncbi:MAG TPA: amidohydrolase family protein [Microthrixaceae bacterium]|nr:amidohydrolase family protein [Microthrixaceae bacterium]